MKQTILILMVLIAVSSNMNAQDNGIDSRDYFSFSLKAGVNYSNVYDTKNEVFNADPKFGFAGGASFSIPIGTIIGIQPEILYSQKGFQTTGSTYKFMRTSSYIDIPLFLAVKPSEFLTLLAGPQFSYLIDQKDVFNSGSTSTTTQQDFENNNLRKNILCFVMGADINYMHTVFGLRAGWDVQDNNGNGTVTNPRYKNLWYQATIGYRF